MLADVERERVRRPLEEAWTLPPRAYTDPAVWDREIEVIFARDWVCLARVEQLPQVGSQLAVELAGRPLVLTRDETGTIRALSNVCLHRAMPLVEGSADGRHLVCPYHLWSYRLDGRLHTAPLMEGCRGFDRDQQRLPEASVEVWEGFVFVSLADDPPPLTPRLEPLRNHVAGYGLGELVVADTLVYDSPWNWKLLVENFMEAYHHIGPHRDTFQPLYPAARSWAPDNGGGPWTYLHMPGDPERSHDVGLPFLPGLSDQQRIDLVAASIFPTFLIAGSGTLVTWYQLEPRAHDEMTLRIHLLLPPDLLASPEVAEKVVPVIMDGLRSIHAEDIAVNEGPWRGLHSPLARQGRLSPLEKPIWQQNQLWLDRLEPAPVH